MFLWKNVETIFNSPKPEKEIQGSCTACKVSKYGVTSGAYFPVFGLNTEIYGVNSVFSPNKGKYQPEVTPYLGTFHAVLGCLYLRFKNSPSFHWSCYKNIFNPLMPGGNKKVTHA